MPAIGPALLHGSFLLVPFSSIKVGQAIKLYFVLYILFCITRRQSWKVKLCKILAKAISVRLQSSFIFDKGHEFFYRAIKGHGVHTDTICCPRYSIILVLSRIMVCTEAFLGSSPKYESHGTFGCTEDPAGFNV